MWIINEVSDFFQSFIKYVIPVYQFEQYSIYEIINLKNFCKNLLKFLDETDLRSIRQGPRNINKVRKYYDDIGQKGIKYKSVKFEEWKSSILSFDIRGYVNKVTDKTYIRGGLIN